MEQFLSVYECKLDSYLHPVEGQKLMSICSLSLYLIINVDKKQYTSSTASKSWSNFLFQSFLKP